MISDAAARAFAQEWIAAWNSHELARILSHYSPGFEMASPLIVELANEPAGTLRGHAAVGAYWSKALARSPDLRFELIGVFRSIDSVVIHYRNQAGRVGAEWFEFDGAGRVTRAAAHYA